MRVLVASTAGAGHFGPLVPFVEACRRAAHEVLVAAPASFAGTVESAGFPFWPCGDAPPEEWQAVMARLPSLSFEEAEAVVVGDVFGRIDTTAILPRMLAAVEEFQPDVVLREPAEFGSALAAERHGVPTARVAAGLAVTDARMTPIAAKALGPIRSSLGLPEDPDGRTLIGSPAFTVVPLSFEDEECPGPPDTVRVRDDGMPPPKPLPDWWDGDAASHPLVYVTFGSVAATVPMFGYIYRAVIDALDGLPIRVLLTLGRDIDVGHVPSNFRVETWVPQADVLHQASAMVCHCGFGTTLGAIASGVPVVAVPLFADQPANARRLQATGAGILVDGAGQDGEAVRSAVTTVLDDRSYAGRAQALAEEIRQLPPVDVAVDELRRIAAR